MCSLASTELTLKPPCSQDKSNKVGQATSWRQLAEFEILEHVSDVYVRARGKDLMDALVGLAMGHVSVLIRNPESVELRKEAEIDIEAKDIEEAVYLWLGELIYLFDTRGFLLGEFSGEVVQGCCKVRVRGIAKGDAYDPSRHIPGTHVKAVTYHDLKVEALEGSTILTVLLDI